MEFQAQPYPTYAYENKYAFEVYTWVDDLTGCLMTGGKEVKYSANFLVIFGLQHKDNLSYVFIIPYQIYPILHLILPQKPDCPLKHTVIPDCPVLHVLPVLSVLSLDMPDYSITFLSGQVLRSENTSIDYITLFVLTSFRYGW